MISEKISEPKESVRAHYKVTLIDSDKSQKVVAEGDNFITPAVDWYPHYSQQGQSAPYGKTVNSLLPIGYDDERAGVHHCNCSCFGARLTDLWDYVSLRKSGEGAVPVTPNMGYIRNQELVAQCAYNSLTPSAPHGGRVVPSGNLANINEIKMLYEFPVDVGNGSPVDYIFMCSGAAETRRPAINGVTVNTRHNQNHTNVYIDGETGKLYSAWGNTIGELDLNTFHYITYTVPGVTFSTERNTSFVETRGGTRYFYAHESGNKIVKINLNTLQQDAITPNAERYGGFSDGNFLYCPRSGTKQIYKYNLDTLDYIETVTTASTGNFTSDDIFFFDKVNNWVVGYYTNFGKCSLSDFLSMGLDAITKSSSRVFTECSGLEMHETSPTFGRLASYYYDCGDGNYWGVWISSSTGHQTTWLKKFYKPNSGGSSTFASCFKCNPPIPPKERGQTWRVEVTVRKSGMILPAGI